MWQIDRNFGRQEWSNPNNCDNGIQASSADSNQRINVDNPIQSDKGLQRTAHFVERKNTKYENTKSFGVLCALTSIGLDQV